MKELVGEVFTDSIGLARCSFNRILLIRGYYCSWTRVLIFGLYERLKVLTLLYVGLIVFRKFNS